MGDYDSEGIYFFDEDGDSPAPFSDMINLLSEAASNEIANDRARLAALELRGADATYVPTLTGATVGNGTLSGLWARNGDLVHWSFFLFLGTTSTVAASPTFFGISPPVTPRANTLAVGSGWVSRGTSVTNFTLTTWRASGAIFQPWYNGGRVTSPSPLAGGTWVSGDVIAGGGVYLAA